MRKKLRILYVVHDFPPEVIAGTELHALWISRELSKQFEIFIFTRTYDPSLGEYVVRDEVLRGLRIRRVKFSDLDWMHPANLYLNPRIEDLFEAYLEEVKPNLVHVHHTVGLSASIIQIIAERGYPMLLQIQDFHYMCDRMFLRDASDKLCDGPQDGGKCAKCIRLDSAPFIPKDLLPLYSGNIFEQAGIERTDYMKTLMLLPNRIISPSQFVKNKFVEFGVPESRILVMPIGVSVKPFHGRPQRHKKRVVFGFLGNVVQHKGVQILIEAFRRVDEKRARLEIHGATNDVMLADKFRAEASNLDVRFMGAYSQVRLPRILLNLDAVILPSIVHESYSLVAHEALAAKVPVIVSSIPAQGEAVREGVDGFHFRHDDPADLARIMNTLARHPEKLAELRRSIRKVRSVKDESKEMAELYRELIQAEDDNEARSDVIARLRKIRQMVDTRAFQEQMLLRRASIANIGDLLPTLLAIYKSRADLQKIFPEAREGKYDGLMSWAIDTIERKHSDTAYQQLASSASKPFLAYLQSLVSQVGERDQKMLELQRQLDEVRQALVSQVGERDQKMLELQRELDEVRHSFGYKFMRFYASKIDGLFPEGTARGEFRHIITHKMRTMTEQGTKASIDNHQRRAKARNSR